MINNIDRLKQQLKSLMKDPRVTSELHPNIRQRALNILNINKSPNSSMNQYQYQLRQQEQQQANSELDQGSYRILFREQQQQQTDHQKISEDNQHYRQNENNIYYHKNMPDIRIDLKKIIKYQKVHSNSQSSSKYANHNDSTSKSKSKTKLQKTRSKDRLRYNTETSSLSKSKSYKKQIMNSNHNTKSFKKIIITKQRNEDNKKITNVINGTSKYSSFNTKQNNIKGKKSANDVSAFKNIKLPLKDSTLNINQYKNNQLCQTEPSRIVSNTDKYNFKQLNTLKVQKKTSQNDLSLTKKWSFEESFQSYQKFKQKQEELLIEKESLQQKIKYYRYQIQSQKDKTSTSKINIDSLNTHIGKSMELEKVNKDGISINMKKTENKFIENKKLQHILENMRKSSGLISENIQQEKQLISMYQTVIEQLKHQLKLEQTQKSSLIRNLVNLKNQEKMILQKYAYQQAFNDQIYSTLQKSFQNL